MGGGGGRMASVRELALPRAFGSGAGRQLGTDAPSATAEQPSARLGAVLPVLKRARTLVAPKLRRLHALPAGAAGAQVGSRYGHPIRLRWPLCVTQLWIARSSPAGWKAPCAGAMAAACIACGLGPRPQARPVLTFQPSAVGFQLAMHCAQRKSAAGAGGRAALLGTAPCREGRQADAAKMFELQTSKASPSVASPGLQCRSPPAKRTCL